MNQHRLCQFTISFFGCLAEFRNYQLWTADFFILGRRVVCLALLVWTIPFDDASMVGCTAKLPTMALLSLQKYWSYDWQMTTDI